MIGAREARGTLFSLHYYFVIAIHIFGEVVPTRYLIQLHGWMDVIASYNPS